MDETNEIKKFGDIKSVLVYLEQVKNGLQNKSFSEQIEFKEEIKKLHDKRQIQMFLGRLEDQVEIRKMTSYLNAPYFAIMTLTFGGFMNFFMNSFKELGFGFLSVPLFIYMILILLSVIWHRLGLREIRSLKKLKCYKRLLQECLDEMPDKRHFKRRV